MGFVSAKEIQNASVSRPTGRPYAGAHSSVTFATSVVHTKGRKPTKYLTLNIGGNVAKEAGLKVGDAASLGIDRTKGLGLISKIKNPDEGWMLSGSKPNAQGTQTLKLRFTWHKGLPSIDKKSECRNVKIDKPGTIQFTFPEGTDFDGVEFQEEGKNGHLPFAGTEKRKERRDVPDRRGTQYGRRSTDRTVECS